MAANFLLTGALAALLGVGMGAFGAHGLKATLTPDMLNVYKTAVDYQMWHALGLILIAMLMQTAQDGNWLVYAGYFISAGIILFSGSLYVLSIFNLKALGMITPFGGVAFLVGWALLALHAYSTLKPS